MYVMDPQRYCLDALERLRRERPPELVDLDDSQKVAILSYVAQHALSGPDFERQLGLLVEVAEHANRRHVLEAASEILQDLQRYAAQNRLEPA